MHENTIPFVFKRTVDAHRDRIAIRSKEFGIWHDITWGDYYDNVKYVAQGLISLGFKKSDRVAIIGDNSKEWVYVDMAAFCTGGVTVGIYSTNSFDQCQFIIEHSDSRFFFVENEEQLDKWLLFRDKTPTLEKVIVWDLKGLRDFSDPMLMSFNDLVEMGKKGEAERPGLIEKMMDDVKPEDHALFIYTSGTTGRPKGAILNHRNVSWIGSAMTDANPVRITDEVLSFLPLCHIFEQMFTVLIHVTHGYTVNFIENLETVSDNMKEVSPTVGYAVPRIWEKYYSMITIKMSDATLFKRIIFKGAMMIGEAYIRRKEKNGVPFYLRALYALADLAVFRKLKERLGFERMRMAFSGAAPISPGVLRFFNLIGLQLLEGYGQTEGTGVTSANRENHAKIGTVGPPLPNVECKIAEDGEILVKSPGVFQGYHKDPAVTAETLIDGWLHTGDTGEIDEDGYVKITGRKKDIIITSGGKNITPQFIEGKLVFSPYINDAIVIGDKRHFLTAIIVLDEENAVKYAQDRKLQFSTYRDLAQHPEIVKLIHEEVEKANRELSRVEQVKKFTILPHKLYEEEGDVTPTMKVKRAFINKKYSDLINGMYRS